MASLTGIGGEVLHRADAAATKAWYARILGLAPNVHGGFRFMEGESAEAFGEGARTIFARCGRDTDCDRNSRQTCRADRRPVPDIFAGTRVDFRLSLLTRRGINRRG